MNPERMDTTEGKDFVCKIRAVVPAL